MAAVKRSYADQTLKAIKERQFTITEDGLEVLIKPIPETDEPGVLDPRFYEGVVQMFKSMNDVFEDQKIQSEETLKPDLLKSAYQMRQGMDKVKSIPIVLGVDRNDLQVTRGNKSVPIRIYTPAQRKEGLVPVFYYIHGGGFVAGSMDVVEEMCKLVVEKTGCIAIQPGYCLAPEHPYPAGLDDCYEVLKWIYANIKEYGGDPEKICISGDSAGGNLATVCAMKDRDEHASMVKVQALLYPTVDAAHMAENMVANRGVYEIGEKHSKELNGMFDMMFGSLTSPTLGECLGVEDDTIPYISPALGELEGMPPVIILLGEYDFLRLEDDRYAHKLKHAGVEVKLVRYKGLSHGFADQIGITPQAEDAMEEIGTFMLEHLAQ